MMAPRLKRFLQDRPSRLEHLRPVLGKIAGFGVVPELALAFLERDGPGQKLQERRFPRPVWADEREYAPFLDFERDLIELIGIDLALSPKTFFIAFVSM